MCVFISDVDKAACSVQFKLLICMNNTLSSCWVAHQSLKTKEKSSWATPKVVAATYDSIALKSLSHSSNEVSQRWS